MRFHTAILVTNDFPNRRTQKQWKFHCSFEMENNHEIHAKIIYEYSVTNQIFPNIRQLVESVNRVRLDLLKAIVAYLRRVNFSLPNDFLEASISNNYE